MSGKTMGLLVSVGIAVILMIVVAFVRKSTVENEIEKPNYICLQGVRYYMFSVGTEGYMAPVYEKDKIPTLVLCNEDDQ